MALEKFLSKKETATTLGVRERKVHDLIKGGDIRARRIGRRVLVPESEIRRFQDALPLAYRPTRIRSEER